MLPVRVTLGGYAMRPGLPRMRLGSADPRLEEDIASAVQDWRETYIDARSVAGRRFENRNVRLGRGGTAGAPVAEHLNLCESNQA